MKNAESSPDIDAVRRYLVELQERIEVFLMERDATLSVRHDAWEHRDGGGGETRVLSEGALFEKAGVNFSEIRGSELPESASARHPHLAGSPYRALGVSVIVHPRNPYVPAAHLNVRCFHAFGGSAETWWFGGGFDLTPCYAFLEDAVHWHRAARDACTPFDPAYYPRFKAACDAYFHLPHRNEGRGIGGVFFDDFAEGGFARAFAFARSVGDHFLKGYAPIVDRRKGRSYGKRERTFQAYRRGRYAEFNLAWDRGTRFGLQSGGRIESILASLPPLARWDYDYRPEPGSPEAELDAFLQPREWIGRGG